jgi:hypothetical protein
MPATVAVRMDPSNEDFIDMRATAMAFRDKEGDTVIVINADYNIISELVGNNVKRLVSNATGVPVDHITISASHQHSSPAISTVYWTNQAGDHTVSRDLTGVTSGTYKTLIYGNEKLQLWEEWQIRTNYYDTFYTGVRDAAVAAYNDLADVISVKAGIMDTTTGGKQFNFVRNVALYKGDDYNNVLGIITDNHTTHLRIGDIYYAHATVENGVVIAPREKVQHHHEHHHEEHSCGCGHHHEHHHEEHSCGCGHHHDHEHHHHHEHGEHCSCGCGGHHHNHHADEVFTSWGVETAKKFTVDMIEAALEDLDLGKYGMVLRAKGIVPAADGTWIHFDFVPGEKNVRLGSADITGKLCVIGSKLDEKGIAALFGV